MRYALVPVLCLMAQAGPAVAQAPSESAPPGPHNPNPPPTAPDLQPSSPCEPNATLAQNSIRGTGQAAAGATDAGRNEQIAGVSKPLADMQCAGAAPGAPKPSPAAKAAP